MLFWSNNQVVDGYYEQAVCKIKDCEKAESSFYYMDLMITWPSMPSGNGWQWCQWIGY